MALDFQITNPDQNDPDSMLGNVIQIDFSAYLGNVTTVSFRVLNTGATPVTDWLAAQQVGDVTWRYTGVDNLGLQPGTTYIVFALAIGSDGQGGIDKGSGSVTRVKA